MEFPLKVSKLTINNSTLKHILFGAFNTPVFQRTLTSLTINNLLYTEYHSHAFNFISKGSFLGLETLNILVLTDNPSVEILDDIAFTFISRTLTQLTISRTAHPWALERLFEHVRLQRIILVNLKGNNFPSLHNSSFIGIADTTRSLILTNSKIKFIEAGTFANFMHLQWLYLQYNQLRAVPPGTFDLLLKSPTFRTVSLQGNYWHCDCDFLHTQTIVIGHPDAFPGTLNCFTPTGKRDLPIISVSVCDGETDDPSIEPPNPTGPTPPLASSTTEATSTQNEGSTVAQESSTEAQTSTPTLHTTPFDPTTPIAFFGINVDCYRGTVQTNSVNYSDVGAYSPPAEKISLRLLKPDVSFTFESVSSEFEAQIVFDNISGRDIALVYFPGVLDTSDLTIDGIANDINCLTIVSTTVFIKDLQPSTVYTFCALMRNQPMQTPFQCKAYQTQTPFKHQAWINQGKKLIYITSFLMVLLLCFVIGGILTYLIIRTKPTLIKGSKRVVLVNNKTKDVMILPGQSRSNSWKLDTSQKVEPPTYITPLPRRSMDNK